MVMRRLFNEPARVNAKVQIRSILREEEQAAEDEFAAMMADFEDDLYDWDLFEDDYFDRRREEELDRRIDRMAQELEDAVYDDHEYDDRLYYY